MPMVRSRFASFLSWLFFEAQERGKIILLVVSRGTAICAFSGCKKPSFFHQAAARTVEILKWSETWLIIWDHFYAAGTTILAKNYRILRHNCHHLHCLNVTELLHASEAWSFGVIYKQFIIHLGIQMPLKQEHLGKRRVAPEHKSRKKNSWHETNLAGHHNF